MSTNIFIDENIKLVQIEIIKFNEIITSYNYIPFETLKRFNKFLLKYKKVNTCYGEITNNTIKIMIIHDDDTSYNELYQLVNNSFYEPKINFDKIYQNINDPLTVTFNDNVLSVSLEEDNFQEALSEIIANTEKMKQTIGNLELTEPLSDDDVSDHVIEGKIVDEETYNTETNI